MDSWTIARIRNIPLRLHFSFLLAIPYFTLVIAAQFGAMAQVAGINPGDLRIPALGWGVMLAVGLFLSVAVHEFAHVLVAKQRGRVVQGVTLMLLGGISQIEPAEGTQLQSRDHDEAWIAIVGPFVSVVISIVLFMLFRLLRGPEDLSFGLFYLAQINMTIGIFNLIPAFPLDGGRLLRALLHRALGEPRGTRITVAIGQGFAFALGLFAIWTLNLILLLISVFIFAAGRNETRAQLYRARLGGVRADQLMHSAGQTFEASLPVSEALTRIKPEERIPVVIHRSSESTGGHVIGFVDEHLLSRIPNEQRTTVPVGFAADVDVPRVRPSDSAERAVDMVFGRDDDGSEVVAVVDDEGELVGLIDRGDILKKAA